MIRGLARITMCEILKDVLDFLTISGRINFGIMSDIRRDGFLNKEYFKVCMNQLFFISLLSYSLSCSSSFMTSNPYDFLLFFHCYFILLQGSVIIIGAGFAGLSAAVQLTRAGCKVLPFPESI